MRPVPLIRNSAQSKGTGKAVTRMIARGVRRVGQPGPASSPAPREMPVQAIYPVEKSQADGKPDREPSHCHKATPAIGDLVQAASAASSGSARCAPRLGN